MTIKTDDLKRSYSSKILILKHEKKKKIQEIHNVESYKIL